MQILNLNSNMIILKENSVKTLAKWGAVFKFQYDNT